MMKINHQSFMKINWILTSVCIIQQFCQALDPNQLPSCGSYQPAPILNPLHFHGPKAPPTLKRKAKKDNELWLKRVVSDLLGDHTSSNSRHPQRKPSSVLDEAPSAIPFYTPMLTDFPMDYYGESTRGDLIPSKEYQEAKIELDAVDMKEASDIYNALKLDSLGWPAEPFSPVPAHRAVFCSRTLNFRSIRCIGYDMDYTLVHYKVVEWEGRAYHYAKEYLRQAGFPVDDLSFCPDLVCRGLVIDKELGNMIKVDKFGYVKRAMHGSQRLSSKETHSVYGRQLVDLRDGKRWVFLNTLFSVSEGCLFAQLVDKQDLGLLNISSAAGGPPVQLSYDLLFNAVSKALFRAHVEGKLKDDVTTNTERYVELDEDLPRTLLDQKEAGKKLALITNSDWAYTKSIMSFVFDRYLPGNTTWRDVFDVIVVSARKPSFFSQSMPVYELVTEDGLMREAFQMKEGHVYSGGSASMIEKLFHCDSDDIMYIGDHIFTDVNVAKGYMRWRTALIVRELEDEVVAYHKVEVQHRFLRTLMRRKDLCGVVLDKLRTELNRAGKGRSAVYAPAGPGGAGEAGPAGPDNRTQQTLHLVGRLLVTMADLDNQIAPMLYDNGAAFNPHWGFLSGAGPTEKSHLMRQIEKYADVYTSRVSNFLRYTPYVYFRSFSTPLAHLRSAELELQTGEGEGLGLAAAEEPSPPPLRAQASLGGWRGEAAAAAAEAEAAAAEARSLRGLLSSDPTPAHGAALAPGPVLSEEPPAEAMEEREFGHEIRGSGISALDDN